MADSGALNLAQYGAFGEEGPANIGRIGFTGRFCDADRTTRRALRYDPRVRLPEIGLDYYFQASWARFYDPQIGRFLTPDPAGFVDGPNLYAYVLNDPINNVDPSGLQGDRAVSEPITIPGQRPTRPRFLGFPNNRDFASRSDGDGRPNGDIRSDNERVRMMGEERAERCVGIFTVAGATVGALAAIPGFALGGAVGFGANVALFSVSGTIIGFEGGLVLAQQFAARESPSRSVSPGSAEATLAGGFFATAGATAGLAVGVITAPAVGLVSAGVGAVVAGTAGAAAGTIAGTNAGRAVCM